MLSRQGAPGQQEPGLLPLLGPRAGLCTAGEEQPLPAKGRPGHVLEGGLGKGFGAGRNRSLRPRLQKFQ